MTKDIKISPAKRANRKPVAKAAVPGEVTVEMAPVAAPPVAPPVEVVVEAVMTATAPEPVSKVKSRKAKETRPKKVKLVRDSFTFPEDEYAQIALLKQRVLKSGREVKKSELLRAGLAALSAFSDTQLTNALNGIAKLKQGRPSK